MKLITEFNDSLIEFKTEDTETEEGLKVKEYYIEGIFMQADVKNRNGRIYEKKVLRPAVERYIREQVDQDRAVGELNHPAGPTVNLDKVSHKIEALYWEGSDVYGRAKILDTPMGQTVKKLLEGGVRLGVSSRGMGSIVKKDGVDFVKDDFVINTVDIVQDPSAHHAFVNGVMEGVEWQCHNGSFVPVQAFDPEDVKRFRKFGIDLTDSDMSEDSREPESINTINEKFIRAFREMMSRT